VIDIVRVRDGKMVEHWNVVDAMALMTPIAQSPRRRERGSCCVEGAVDPSS
jgi:hypothetical protein